MATPHVAGAAALVWSWMGRRFVSDLEDLRSIILESAERVAWLSGWVTTGLLDVEAMVFKALFGLFEARELRRSRGIG